MRRLLAGAAVAWLATAGLAQAQVYLPIPDTPRRGSVEVGGGLWWNGGFGIESLPAELTANAGNDAPPVTLFNTESNVGTVSGVQGRIGFFLSSSLSLEAGAKYSRPVLAVRVFDDFEEAEGLTAEQTMSRYLFDGSLLLHPQRWRFAGGRAAPFVIAGAGYLRELHEGRELVETGRTYHAGFGVKYWLTQGRRRVGIRGEALYVVRDRGYGSDSARRSHPAVGATLSYLF